MTVPKAVRGWVADAEARHAPAFDEWGPTGFDWRGFCADAPSFAERLGERWGGAQNAAAARQRLEETAASAYRGAYVATLALLAGYDGERDPDAALERLVEPLGDEEATLFDESVAEDLGTAEEALAVADAERSAAPGGRPGAVARIGRLVAPPVRSLLTEGLASAADERAALGATVEVVARVLSGVVRVGIAVAALRYVAAVEADRAAGTPPLSYDAAALRSALAEGSS